MILRYLAGLVALISSSCFIFISSMYSAILLFSQSLRPSNSFF